MHVMRSYCLREGLPEFLKNKTPGQLVIYKEKAYRLEKINFSSEEIVYTLFPIANVIKRIREKYVKN